MSRLVDLSHKLAPGMPAYPGLPEPQFRTWFTHEESATRGTYSPGTTFQIATYELGGNTGTYVDAPFHRHPAGPDLAGLPLEKLADLPGIVVEGVAEGEVLWQAFEGLDLRGKAVLVRTGWAQRWGGPDYFRSGPYLEEDVCHRLVEAGVALVGIDCANIDNMSDSARPAHTVLLAAGIPIVEHLRGLDQLPSEGFRFFAVPPAIEGGTSFAVRAFAIVDA
ncbi:MAG: cyclase family protein [Chloroflexota bacterium]|nr:cyclase family protein [Chloroflexota bacterium]MDQ5867059.1 cyclase family protein [Chloroflexota bacterium]